MEHPQQLVYTRTSVFTAPQRGKLFFTGNPFVVNFHSFLSLSQPRVFLFTLLPLSASPEIVEAAGCRKHLLFPRFCLSDGLSWPAKSLPLANSPQFFFLRAPFFGPYMPLPLFAFLKCTVLLASDHPKLVKQVFLLTPVCGRRPPSPPTLLPGSRLPVFLAFPPPPFSWELE